MKSVWLGIFIMTCSPWLFADSKTNTVPCFSVKKAEIIGKEIETLLKQEYCANDKDATRNFALTAEKILPTIMNKSFLGVEPPVGWEASSEDIINNCMQNTNLCKKDDRQQFNECVKSRVPLLLVQFAPWIADNCTTLNKNIIEGWPTKKKELINSIHTANTINENNNFEKMP
ncbi:hypothetical protein Lade_1299 [Legionella adelaidensis]|uniref:Secreted protein n=1 Tax=Legionella adelaidensis TaxID=45056 RepID=A0A0W0R6F5_9GAMM|nr:hypothetical protein [Legionella adelaidensis]KTC66641.1 hypothetical protein Lade_1299 [Legionella adelaidensis]